MKETQANLLKAIAGESMARNKYDYYADIATKEGHIWIAEVFKETANNERAHAKEELEQICGQAEMTNTYSINALSDTLTNLRHAARGEEYEYTIMYPEFKKKAEEEGDERATELFQEISEVEEKHFERFTKLADTLEAGNLYKSEEEVEWKCLNCGYIHRGTEAPEKCPVCKKPRSWYMRLNFVR
ncbi:MAG: rubrerythrin family protein [Patescibacteria group bacterium]|jgi:rubrerythrin